MQFANHRQNRRTRLSINKNTLSSSKRVLGKKVFVSSAIKWNGWETWCLWLLSFLTFIFYIVPEAFWRDPWPITVTLKVKTLHATSAASGPQQIRADLLPMLRQGADPVGSHRLSGAVLRTPGFHQLPHSDPKTQSPAPRTQSPFLVLAVFMGTPSSYFRARAE